MSGSAPGGNLVIFDRIVPPVNQKSTQSWSKVITENGAGYGISSKIHM